MAWVVHGLPLQAAYRDNIAHCEGRSHKQTCQRSTRISPCHVKPEAFAADSIPAAPATVVSVSGAPRISHRGACASAVDAATLAGEPRMCTPSMVAEMTYWPVVRAQYVYECTAALTAPAVAGVGAGPCTWTYTQRRRSDIKWVGSQHLMLVWRHELQQESCSVRVLRAPNSATTSAATYAALLDCPYAATS